VRAERPLDEALDGKERHAAGTPRSVGLERVVDVVLVADVDELAPQRQLLQPQRDHLLRQGPDEVPGLGGFGATRLVDYARNVSGVQMTLGEAKNFRDKLIQEVYPELDLYFSENEMTLFLRRRSSDP
jgi:hypothetical protein